MEAGVIVLTAAGGGTGRSLHDWWISYNGVQFVRLDPTIQAHTLVSGLAGKTDVYFMHQVINESGPQGFDLVIQITVNR